MVTGTMENFRICCQGNHKPAKVGIKYREVTGGMGVWV